MSKTGVMNRANQITRAVDSKLNLGEYWNQKLSGKYALAPRNIQNGQFIDLTKALYGQYNLEYDNHCSDYIRQELVIMNREKESSGETLKHSVICVFGPGFGRGLRFAYYADREAKMTIKLYDVSRQAVGITNSLIRSKGIHRKSTATTKEILGDDGEIPDNTKLIVMSQFLQILRPESMSSIMKMIARYTERNRDCKTIIVHPFHNNDEVAGWGDTTPYTLDELLSPTKEVLGERFIVAREASWKYFDYHNYMAITLAFS